MAAPATTTLQTLGGSLFEEFFRSIVEQENFDDSQKATLGEYLKGAIEKRDRLGEFIARMEAEADAIKKEETRLADRQELGLRRDLLEKAMTHLNDRERHILGERRLKDNPTTLEDLSQQYGISRERVRQIEVRAFEKLQKAIKAAAIERRLVAA